MLPCWKWGWWCTRSREGTHQESWLQLAMYHHAQHINYRESWPGAAAQEGAGHQLVGGEQLVFICITCFSWALFFSLSVTFPFTFWVIIFVIIISFIKLFIFNPGVSHFYLFDSLPHPTGGKWETGSEVVNCWLEWNCDTPSKVSSECLLQLKICFVYFYDLLGKWYKS